LDTRGLNRIELVGQRLAKAGAGCCWEDVSAFAEAHGLGLPVTVSSRHATVGGTISVGGFGPTSISRGALAEHIASLDVVTGKGDVLSVGPNSHAELFETCVGGFGTCAVITSATIRLEPTRPWIVLRNEYRPDRADIGLLAVEIARSPWDWCRIVHLNDSQRWKIELGHRHSERPDDVPGTVVVHRPDRLLFDREDAFSGCSLPKGTYRLWADFVLPSQSAQRFFEANRSLFTDARVCPASNSLLLNPKRPRTFPLLPLPEAPALQTFGFYGTVRSEQSNHYVRLLDNAAESCLGFGGRQYLHGYHADGEDSYRRLYGDALFRRLMATKRRFDPAGLLGPGDW
jgi:FAD/FMN-containing dehydrogenase